MVAGKNTPSTIARAAAQSSQQSGPQLPPLPKLKIRRPDRADANPCIGVMSSVLGCWASQGYSTQGCAALEQSLRACMDARKPTQAKKSSINHHLSRLYPQIIGPHKRK